MTELPWYALKVRSRSEMLAITSLDHYGFESYCPQTKARTQYSDRSQYVSPPVTALLYLSNFFKGSFRSASIIV